MLTIIAMVTRYGKKQTGVEPGQCWPTQEEVQLARFNFILSKLCTFFCE